MYNIGRGKNKTQKEGIVQKINVTYVINLVDLGKDEEFGNMADEDNYFVITGLPTEHVSAFWKEVTNLRGCSRRPVKKGVREDGRLRINWNEFCDYENFLRAKEKILETIKRLVPDVKVYYRQLDRQLGSGFSVAGDYDPDDEMLLEGAFTEEERECLPLDQRADILGISRQ